MEKTCEYFAVGEKLGPLEECALARRVQSAARQPENDMDAANLCPNYAMLRLCSANLHTTNKKCIFVHDKTINRYYDKL
uniref:Coiled-coil-helix-coiled-coil-helix domain-containing protein 7 n=1 Tax=Heterorhabditis bacteriophora TaxID=37862 RepID=A0A1I7WQ40_HETBA